MHHDKLHESAQISFTSNLTKQLQKSVVCVMLMGDKGQPVINWILFKVIREKSL